MLLLLLLLFTIVIMSNSAERGNQIHFYLYLIQPLVGFNFFACSFFVYVLLLNNTSNHESVCGTMYLERLVTLYDMRL